MVQNSAGLHSERPGQPRHFDLLSRATMVPLEEGSGDRTARDKGRTVAGDGEHEINPTIAV